MPCCIGVRPVVGLSATGTLLPFFIVMAVIQPCFSVCIHCKDSILPAHESAACPLSTDIASNVNLFSTGSLGTIPKLTNLLPPTILRMFPKAALERRLTPFCFSSFPMSFLYVFSLQIVGLFSSYLFSFAFLFSSFLFFSSRVGLFLFASLRSGCGGFGRRSSTLGDRLSCVLV